MKDTEVRLTKHSIEEYLNDNPNCENPREVLISKFYKFRKLTTIRKAKYWTNFETNVTIIRYNNEAIVFSDNVIITYYRIISLDTVGIQMKFNKRVHKVLGKTEYKIREREIKKWEAKQKRMAKKYEKYNYRYCQI